MSHLIVQGKRFDWKTSTLIITKSSGIFLGVVHDIEIFDFFKINLYFDTIIKQVQGSALLTNLFENHNI